MKQTEPNPCTGTVKRLISHENEKQSKIPKGRYDENRNQDALSTEMR